ncbi:Fe(3+) dicitrate transport protein FecA [Aquicella siphonis]|uniref:Fe(3+) dicitrate transport protein FecA n=2 Tax=Aquicella siphonis TaxID=254247 RepID=A0A5E4PHY6_9COXI|nr:Fe(3+) dicitrate transport protein FecA [Aquicella siphonis]
MFSFIAARGSFLWKRAAALILVSGLAGSAAAAEKPAVIPEVNLHSGQSLRSRQDAQVQTTHISREQIKTSPVLDLSELLAQTQSIVRLTNNSMDNSQTALSIRGFGDNAAANSLILVDGFPLTNVSLLAPNFNSIALADIERIDIIQGSQGTLWGDQAVGGVVNIVTRHPEKFLADAYAGLGNFNTIFYSALAGNKFANGLFFKAFGFSGKSDNYRDHNRQKNESLYAQAGMDYARGTTRLGLQSTDNTVLFPGGLTQAQFDANARQAVNFSNFSHYKTQVLQLLNKQEFGADWILETRLSHQVLTGDGVIGSAFNRKEWETRLSPRLIGSLWNNKITLGYDGEKSRYQFMNAMIEERADAQQNNLYAQMVIPVIETVDVTVGARDAWQYNSAERVIGQPVNSTNRVFVTEQGISWRPSSEWQFFVRRDGNFRFPKANEETWMPAGVSVLQPQTGVSYEAGLVRTTERQKTQLNLYQLQLHDEIAFDPTETPDEPFGTFSNFTSTRRRGITLTEYYRLTPRLALDAQFNYVDARLASGPDSGHHIPAVPAITANAGLGYDFLENWRAKVSTLYTGSRFASLDLGNTGKKQSGYWLDTVSLQYLRKSYEISFEVANLFDTRYPAYALYNAPAQSYLYYPGSGRSFLVTFKANIE